MTGEAGPGTGGGKRLVRFCDPRGLCGLVGDFCADGEVMETGDRDSFAVGISCFVATGGMGGPLRLLGEAASEVSANPSSR